LGRTRSPSPSRTRHPRRRKPTAAEAGVAELTDRIADFLLDIGLAPDRAGDGPFLLRYGSTVVMVQAFDAEGRPWVRIAAVVLTGFHPSLDLLLRILRLNTEVVTGAFQLLEDDTLSFSTTLPGDGLSPEAFALVLASVARVSDDLDDELQALAGGHRAVDVLERG